MDTPVATGLPPAAWNDTAKPWRSTVVVGQLIAEAATRYSRSPALVVDGGRVAHTHASLFQHATRLGRLLRTERSGHYVGVVGRHVPLTVVGILGVTLAGLAYVPIDPQWPVARRAQVLDAVGADGLIGTAADLGDLDELAALVPTLRRFVALDIDEERPPPGAALPVHRRENVREVWDAVARSEDPAQAAGFNLDRGHRFTPDEVGAYARHVAGLVLAERPTSVLELGFGSGLVLREVAPRVTLTSGLDPAGAAVRANRDWADEHGCYVDLVEGFAHDVPRLFTGPYDVAVIASAVQYFPNGQYLGEVLRELAGVVRPGGCIVLADLIPPLGPPSTVYELAPDVLTAIAHRAGWADVEIRPRGAEFPPELARRYDAVLRRPGPCVDVVRIITGGQVARQSAEPLPPEGSPDDVAYVIFTSGSTGQPKGVAVGHRSLVNLIEWVNTTFAVGPADRVLQVSSFCFDLSVYDVFGVLTAGGSLRIVGEETLAEPARLARVIAGERITMWNSAPAMLGWVLPFLAPADPGTPAAELRLALLSGDWIPVGMPDEVRDRFPSAAVVCLGGATEATIWSNVYAVDDVDPAWPSIPYGTPIQNSRYYVLDEDERPLPIGEPGDLYIAGPCLAYGYHGDEDLTSQRFRPDPFAPGERMYATGDRARWLPDGNLQFLGRLDHQVKIRGFRVELGEIESVMSGHELVRAAVVVPVEAAGDRQLAGFFTCTPPGLAPTQLRQAIAEHLPSYLIPATLWRLDELPLTANGKVDRAALARLANGGVA